MSAKAPFTGDDRRHISWDFKNPKDVNSVRNIHALDISGAFHDPIHIPLGGLASTSLVAPVTLAETFKEFQKTLKRRKVTNRLPELHHIISLPPQSPSERIAAVSLV
jgi:hypothetical protein